MTSTLRLAVVALALVLSGCAVPVPDADISVDYWTVKKSSLRSLEKDLRANGGLERVAAQVDRVVDLPEDVEVRVRSCKDGTAFIEEDNAVDFCLQDLIESRDALRESGEKDVKATLMSLAQATLLHELGHAVIDVRNLPITGREEDAADQFEVWQAVSGLKDPDIVLSDAFSYELSNAAYEQTDDDEHGSDGQRAVNMYCWLYGSEPKVWKHLVDGEPLTKYRAEQCRDEWKSLVYAWTTLLAEN